MARIIYEQPSPVRILPRNIDEYSDEELAIVLEQLAGARSAPIPKSSSPSEKGEKKTRTKKSASIMNADDAF